MFYDNTSNRERINVNTSLLTLFSDESALSIGCWNDKLTLKWQPPLGKTETGYTRYDKEHRVQTSVPIASLKALEQAYTSGSPSLKDLVEQHADPGTGKNLAIPIYAKDGASVLLLIYAKDEQGIPSMYLGFTKQMSDGTAGPSIRFKFNKTMVLTNYDVASGHSQSEIAVDGEFLTFMAIVNDMILALPITSHAQKYSDAFRSNGNYNQGNTTSGSGNSGYDNQNMDFNVFQ